MAKGLRASRTKKNNQALSKRVFGPVEAARNERLSAKLLELAQQPKAPKAEMEVDETSTKKDPTEGMATLISPVPEEVALDHRFLSPPPSPSAANAPIPPPVASDGQRVVTNEELFFEFLGAADDLGFDQNGDLSLSFFKADAMQEDDDDANGAPLTRTTTQERSITKQKADRALKKSKIQKRKANPKPQNSMTFGGSKKTRKGGR